MPITYSLEACDMLSVLISDPLQTALGKILFTADTGLILISNLSFASWHTGLDREKIGHFNSILCLSHSHIYQTITLTQTL